MRGQQRLHNPQSRLRPYGREHVGVLRYLFRDLLAYGPYHISIIVEIWNLCKVVLAALGFIDILR